MTTTYDLLKFSFPASLALASLPSFAQESGDGELEVVVVTAQRREERLQDTPLSVQAISSEQLVGRSVSQLADLQRLSPSLTVNNSGGAASPFLRGIGSTVVGSGQFGSVAVYIDGVYTPTSYEASKYLDSAEQIQVLAGPQGALYGRNATGGAIVVSTYTPKVGDPFAAKARFGYGNYDNQQSMLLLSGPLGDEIAGYVTVSRDRHDGYIKNLNPQSLGFHTDDLNDRDSWSANGALTFNPIDNLDLVLRVGHSEKDDRGAFGKQAVGTDVDVFPGLNGSQAYYAGVLQSLGVPPATAAAAGAALLFSNEIGATYDSERNAFTNGILSGKSQPGSFSTFSSDTYSLHAAYELDGLQLSSLTAYSDSETTAATDILAASPASLALPGGALGFSGRFPVQTLQQELQVASSGSPVNWLAGVFYFNSHGNTSLAADLPGGLSFLNARNKFTLDSIAAYAQVKLPITSQWSATLGSRYTSETYQLDDKIDPTNPIVLPGTQHTGNRETSSSRTTYTARLEYDTGPLLVYGGVITGFKGGSLSTSNPSSPAVRPETITSYEAGAKWDATNSFQLNGAVFHYDYNNVQITAVDTASGAALLVNGADATVNGLELQSNLRVRQWLQLRASGVLLDSKYQNDVVAGGTVGALLTKDKRLASAPEHVLTVGGDVFLPLASSGQLQFTVDALFNGGFFLDPENLTGTGGIKADPFTTVDASISYKPNSGAWRLSAYGVNIFDEKYYQSSTVASSLLREASAADPATYGVRFEVTL